MNFYERLIIDHRFGFCDSTKFIQKRKFSKRDFEKKNSESFKDNFPKFRRFFCFLNLEESKLGLTIDEKSMFF